MKDNKMWFIKIENPKASVKFAVCNNGVVYDTEKNIELFILKEEAVYELKKMIKDNIYFLRTVRYFKHAREGTIIRINDTSRRHPYPIKIVGWSYQTEILNIIINELNVKKFIFFDKVL